MTQEEEYLSTGPGETEKYGRQLLRRVIPRAVIALYGDLGTGKTCFVRGLAAELKVRGRPITSPTFTIINEYATDPPLVHIDLYRLHDTDDLLSLGFDEYLERDGIVAIEWADRAEDVIPDHALRVFFSLGETPMERRIRILRSVRAQRDTGSTGG